MIDPNVKKKRQFTIYLTVLIVILPFVFLYLKYADKEPESLAQNFTISRPETPAKRRVKPRLKFRKIPTNLPTMTT